MLSVALLMGAVCLSSSAATNNYCAISAQNTLCLYTTCMFSRNCVEPTPVTMTDAAKANLVAMHNDRRRSVASGTADFSYLGGILLPSAANMREMTWDDELAAMAQAWANQCIIRNDPNRDVSRFKVGQGIVVRKNPDATSDLDRMFRLYFTLFSRNATDLSAADIDSFPADDASSAYTLLIWADSYKLGCASTIFRKDDWLPQVPYVHWLICNYGPEGNVAGQPVYQVGSAATACPTGTVPNNNLCALSQ